MKIFLAFFVTAALGSNLVRLDPHGSKTLQLDSVKSLKDHDECTVCHTETKGKIALKANVATTCFDCHNKSPHSGVAEHMGKTVTFRSGQTEKITCLSCHAPHRAEGRPWQGPGSFFAKINMPTLSSKFRASSNPHPMLKRTCTECHQW